MKQLLWAGVLVGLMFIMSSLDVTQSMADGRGPLSIESYFTISNLTAVHNLDAIIDLKKDLYANPFRYKNKRVGVMAFFEQMISETEGLFRMGSTYVLVTDFPELTLDPHERSFLAGIVIDQRETSVPFLGKVRIPVMKFITLERAGISLRGQTAMSLLLISISGIQ